MIFRAWYADEPFAVAEENWWNRQAEVLSRHGIYSDIGTLSSIQFNGPASRTQMAVTIANLMRDKGITADASKVEAAKSQIADLSDIYPMHQNAVATCWALGIIKGTGGGKFDGNGKTERAAAATVYGRVKNVLAGAPSGSETPPETPTPPATASLVRTMSSTRLNLRADAIVSHSPITDVWATQSMEIRNIADRDSFNAACQTIKDSKMILTQGEINYLGRNVYYNYAVVAEKPDATQKNVDGAMGALCGYGGDYGLQGDGYRIYTIRPLATAITSIGVGAFFQCEKLTSVTIPSSVTSIGGSAFACCDSLTSITIPGNITFMGNGIFNSCEKLTSVIILDGVTSIEQDTFFACKNLTNVAIPSSVTSIRTFAFYHCESLTSVTIPKSLFKIF